ncbi:MAG: ATP-binding protein, partial [Dehalococcoidia bacterium]|nr:ATP-binding protein [Dehalococcoidia bacterium]
MIKPVTDRPSAGKTGPGSRRSLHSRATSPFVGRADELQRLIAALSLAAEGHGGIVFLTGEPGVGKTRLAREALARVRGHGFTV